MKRGVPFDTVADGADHVEYPEPGEVVWCDDTGITTVGRG